MAPYSDEEDDYMSMIIEEPKPRETFTQSKLRKQREAEARARVPSKTEHAAIEAAQREAALSASVLDPSNKGYRMMAKLGFKPGDALGKKKEMSNNSDDPPSLSDHVLAASEEQEQQSGDASPRQNEPIRLVFKENRGGIGLDTEKKRKFREEVNHVVKKAKAEEGEYRDRVRLDREERRTEAQFRAAQKIAEKLDDETEERNDEAGEASQMGGRLREDKLKTSFEGRIPDTGASRKSMVNMKPIKKINVLYRGLAKERQEQERAIWDNRLRDVSLSSTFVPNPNLPSYNDETLDYDDKHALGLIPSDSMPVLDQDLDEEDPELDQFNSLTSKERLGQVVAYLRDTYYYCFWCKYRYENYEMAGCPGTTEADHD